jgi:hypothetical protein
MHIQGERNGLRVLAQAVIKEEWVHSHFGAVGKEDPLPRIDLLKDRHSRGGLYYEVEELFGVAREVGSPHDGGRSGLLEGVLHFLRSDREAYHIIRNEVAHRLVPFFQDHLGLVSICDERSYYCYLVGLSAFFLFATQITVEVNNNNNILIKLNKIFKILYSPPRSCHLCPRSHSIELFIYPSRYY